MNRRDVLKSIAVVPLLATTTPAIAEARPECTELPLSNREIFERLLAHLFRPGLLAAEGQVVMHPQIAIYIACRQGDARGTRDAQVPDFSHIQAARNWRESPDMQPDLERPVLHGVLNGSFYGMVGMLFPRPWADDECWEASDDGVDRRADQVTGSGITCCVPTYRVFADPSLGVSQALVRDPNPVDCEWDTVDIEPGVINDVFPVFTPDQRLEMYERRFDVKMPWA
jgi:hypothetical protein